MEGIDAAHAIKVTHPGVGVVILSQYADESYAFELFRDGTAGLAYLLKDRVGDLQRLLTALREVATGGSVIDPEVVEALVARRAQRLSLSEPSVEKYVNAIFTKLDLTSEKLVHRRVAAVLTFPRDAGLRPPGQLPVHYR
jgi:DNA-binding NarL/FixJ family response regulator